MSVESERRRRVLVTGAGGALGGAVIETLANSGVSAVGLGRGVAPNHFPTDWKRADLVTGGGLEAALDGVTAVVHCASDPRRPDNDLLALDQLLAVLGPKSAHLVFVSIAGIPVTEEYAYYRMKLECERKLSQSGIPHTVVRATQFHPFVDYILRLLSLGPFLFAPRVTLQPVDIGFVAERLARFAVGPPLGRVPDIHGPEVLDFRTLSAEWLKARRQSKLRVRIPVFGTLAALARLERLEGDAGGRRWSEWVAAKASRESVYARKPSAARHREGKNPCCS